MYTPHNLFSVKVPYVHILAMMKVWNALCTFIQEMRGSIKMVQKRTKIERVTDKISEREARFRNGNQDRNTS